MECGGGPPATCEGEEDDKFGYDEDNGTSVGRHVLSNERHSSSGCCLGSSQRPSVQPSIESSRQSSHSACAVAYTWTSAADYFKRPIRFRRRRRVVAVAAWLQAVTRPWRPMCVDVAERHGRYAETRYGPTWPETRIDETENTFTDARTRSIEKHKINSAHISTAT